MNISPVTNDLVFEITQKIYLSELFKILDDFLINYLKFSNDICCTKVWIAFDKLEYDSLLCNFLVDFTVLTNFNQQISFLSLLEAFDKEAKAEFDIKLQAVFYKIVSSEHNGLSISYTRNDTIDNYYLALIEK